MTPSPALLMLVALLTMLLLIVLVESRYPLARTPQDDAQTGRALDRCQHWRVPAGATLIGLGAICALAVGRIWLLLLLLAASGVVRRRRSQLDADRRASALRRALPEVIDSFSVVLGAGGTVADGIRLCASRGPTPVREAMFNVMAFQAGGEPLSIRLSALDGELGSVYRPLVGALVSAERDGAPLATVLGRLGDEARLARRHETELRNSALPVQLLFPLVACFLPAVLIGAIVPLLLVSFGQI